MTFGVLAFVVALLTSVMIHEAGHFLTAKHYGMKASRFFVGFGPTLWSVRRGETEYGVKAIPAGGFVKIEGMTPLEEMPEAEAGRAFWRQPAPRRAVVLGAGSAAHFVIAAVLLGVVVWGIGEARQSTTIARVSPCVTRVDTTACTPADPRSPAVAAGVRPGDRLISLNGRPVKDFTTDFADRIHDHPAGPVTLVIDRDGRRLTLHPSLQRVTLDDGGKKVTLSLLGVSPAQTHDRPGLLGGASWIADTFGSFVTGSFTGLAAIPASIPKLWDTMVGSAPRDAQGLSSVVGVARVSGQAFTAKAPLADRVATFVLLVAALNVFVGVFNMLPLLPLDGGHFWLLAYEGARSRLARWRGRPDPGRVDIAKLMPAAYLFIIFFVGLSLLLVAADIVHPVADPFR